MEKADPRVALSLTCKRADEALAFYEKAFDAKELFKMALPDGNLAHAEMSIGGVTVFLSCEAPEWQAFAMPDGMMSSCLISITTDDCAAAFQKAVDAGASPLVEPMDQFWGERTAVVLDPFGYRWGFGEKVEELTPEEIRQRAGELYGNG